MMPGTVLATIRQQINAAKTELLDYTPREMRWPARTLQSAERLIPWLQVTSRGLKKYVEDVLNASATLRTLWSVIREHVGLPQQQILEFERHLKFDDILRESVTGEVVSKVVTQYLTGQNADLKSNGRSDYPDLYLQSLDYSELPLFRKRRAENQEYGAALKGPERRPVRVPDGLEIKTSRDTIRVDCHHPHPGLHLVLVFSETNRVFAVTDISVAFLCSGDYREAGRNTTATTPKYSFNGDRFVSLLRPDS
jgi:hypothetical protein